MLRSGLKGFFSYGARAGIIPEDPSHRRLIQHLPPPLGLAVPQPPHRNQHGQLLLSRLRLAVFPVVDRHRADADERGVVGLGEPYFLAMGTDPPGREAGPLGKIRGNGFPEPLRYLSESVELPWGTPRGSAPFLLSCHKT